MRNNNRVVGARPSRPLAGETPALLNSVIAAGLLSRDLLIAFGETRLRQTRHGYGFPVTSLRDWVQGRRAPDAAAESYLRVIARPCDGVAMALWAA